MIKLTFSAVILTSLIIITGCSKDSNVVAPSGSTITVSAIPGLTVKAGVNVTVSALVMDSNGKPMNGVGVRFSSSNPSVASFSSTSSVTQVSADTNASGIANVIVYMPAAGSANIAADIGGASGSAALTVN